MSKKDEIIREITDILSQDDKSKYETNEHIKKADKYLKKNEGNKEEIEWLDTFFEYNKNTMREIINRIISKGSVDIEGYKEGYFNEIIQNANDLKYPDKNNAIEFTVGKENEEYILEATYKDNGFSISDIYSFLHKGMSNKVEGQTGRFGIGIKSLFAFVNYFKIESNIIIEFEIEENIDDENVVTKKVMRDIVEKNNNWKNEETKITIKYKEKCEDKNDKVNTKKLSEFIEAVNNNEQECCISKLYTGKDDEILFDIRSLLFANNNMKNDYPLSRISFSSESNKDKIEVLIEKEIELNVNFGKKSYNIKKEKLNIFICNELKIEEKYISFYDEKEKNTFAFRIKADDDSSQDEGISKYYSTYLIKSEKGRYSFDIYINTNNTNSSRNSMSSSGEENEIKEKIKNNLKEIVNLILSDEFRKKRKELKKVDNINIKKDISKIFYNIVYQELIKNEKDSIFNKFMENNETNEEFYKTNKNLSVIKEEINNLNYIINIDNRFENNNEYDLKKYLLDLDKYFKKYEKSNLYLINGKLYNKDYKEIEFLDKVTEEVYKIVNKESHEDKESQEKISKYYELLSYFKSEKEYIYYYLKRRVYYEGRELDIECIDKLILKYNNEQENVLKIIGMNNLTSIINENGEICIANFSLKDYLLLKSYEGLLGRTIKNKYEKEFGHLKSNLERYEVKLQQAIGRSKINMLYYRIKNDELEKLKNNITDRKNESLDLNCKFSFLKRIIEEKEINDDYKKIKDYIHKNKEIGWILVDEYDFRKNEEFRNNEEKAENIIYLDKILNIETERQNDLKQIIEIKNSLKKISPELNKELNIEYKINELKALEFNDSIFKLLLEEDINIEEEIKNGKLKIKLKEFIYSEKDIIGMHKRKFIKGIYDIEVYAYKIASGGNKHKVVYMFENENNNKIFIKKGSESEYLEMGKFEKTNKNKNKENRLAIFFYTPRSSIDNIIANILERVQNNKCSSKWLNYFIAPQCIDITRNNEESDKIISKVNSINKKETKNIFDWEDANCLPDVKDYEFTKHILESRGNYGYYCPMCYKISDDKVLVTIINDDDEIPYIITNVCRECFSILKNIEKAKIMNKDILTLEIGIKSNDKIENKIIEIKLSPINIKVIEKFNNYIKSIQV